MLISIHAEFDSLQLNKSKLFIWKSWFAFCETFLIIKITMFYYKTSNYQIKISDFKSYVKLTNPPSV